MSLLRSLDIRISHEKSHHQFIIFTRNFSFIIAPCLRSRNEEIKKVVSALEVESLSISASQMTLLLMLKRQKNYLQKGDILFFKPTQEHKSLTS